MLEKKYIYYNVFNISIDPINTLLEFIQSRHTTNICFQNTQYILYVYTTIN